MSIFQFKHFSVLQADSAMKVGTDAMILGAFVETEGKKNALDVGTGTGVLGLMLAQKNSELAITGIEIDEASAQEANFNFQQSPWSERMNVEHIDFLDFESSLRFDLIVSNPPYFSTTNENEDPRKAQARHVSSLDIAPFLKKVKTILRPDGCFWLIMPAIDFTKWYICAEKNGLRIARKIEIVGKKGNEPIRCILKMNQSAVLPKRETFCIRKADNSYSEEYIELTKEFHGVVL